jgi:hypothetical protein
MAGDLDCRSGDLMQSEDLRKKIVPEHYVSDDVGNIRR